jgi:hypothetical protein
MTVVSRRDRLIDAGALALILVGAALYLAAAVKLHGIAQYTYKHPGPPGALDAADRARYTSYAGVAFVGVGCVVGVLAAGLHRWKRGAAELRGRESESAA